MVFGNNLFMFAGDTSGVDAGDAITNSGMFDAASGDYLSQTFGTPTSTAVFMLSFWYKRANLGTSTTVMGTDTGAGDRHLSRFQADNTLDLTIASTSNTGTDQVYRDPTAWGHCVVSYDGGQATVADRLQIFDNGVEITWSDISGTLPTVSDKLNTAVAHAIGRFQAAQPFDGYLAEVNFVDGTSITAGDYAITHLGRFSTTHTSVWVPITAPALTYGNNGFRLDFADSGDLGKDVSGQGNHWTNSGVTQSSDTPTNVECVLNPLHHRTNATLKEGNLTVDNGTNVVGVGTFGFDPANGGRWEFKAQASASISGSVRLGWAESDDASDPSSGGVDSVYYVNDGKKQVDGTQTAYGATWTNANEIRCAIDFDTNEIEFYKDDVSQGTISNTWTDGKIYHPRAFTNGTQELNVTFTGYTPSDSGKTLEQSNLPNVVDDLGGVDKPYEHFAAIARTGDATADASTVDGFDPVLAWIKNRDQADEHKIVDQVRGATKELNTDSSNAESTDANGVTAFGTNSYTLGTGAGGYNDNAENFIDYLFDGNGAGVSNTDGTINSTVSVSPSGAWSFGTFTGTGANGTVGHGLGGVPEMIVVKNRTDGSTVWVTYHKDVASDPETDYLQLDDTIAATDNNLIWNDTAPTTTVFSVGSNSSANDTSDDMFFIAFRSVPGLCKVGGYEGNGDADGPLLDFGFSPALAIIKRAVGGTGNWNVIDNVRDPYNPGQNILRADTNGAEAPAGIGDYDLLSNGFKLLAVSANANTSGSTYVYLAIADQAIGGGIPFPNAR